MIKPTKKAVFEHLLATGAVRIALDPRIEGVVVPHRFRWDAHLALQFGTKLVPPIEDFVITEGGVSGVLSFGSRREHCIVPWQAVFGVSDLNYRGMIWEEDLPREIREGQTVEQIEPKTERRLRLVR